MVHFGWVIKKSHSTMPRHNRRNDYGRVAALQHIEEARKLSELLGGTDVDVKKYFFALPEGDLKAVLDEYEQQYGSNKREYAEHALPQWRHGRKQMSGLVAERLFKLLPPRMPLSIKYEMVRTIWEKYSPRSDTTFVIGPDCDPAIAAQEMERHLLENVMQYKIPAPMESRFSWLSSGDIAVQQILLNHFLDEERNLIATDARTRTQIILKHFETNEQWTESIRQEYTVGHHKLVLFFDFRASGIQKGRPASASSTRLGQPLTKVAESSGCLVVGGAFLTTGVLAFVGIVMLLI